MSTTNMRVLAASLGLFVGSVANATLIAEMEIGITTPLAPETPVPDQLRYSFSIERGSNTVAVLHHEVTAAGVGTTFTAPPEFIETIAALGMVQASDGWTAAICIPGIACDPNNFQFGTFDLVDGGRIVHAILYSPLDFSEITRVEQTINDFFIVPPNASGGSYGGTQTVRFYADPIPEPITIFTVLIHVAACSLVTRRRSQV